MDIHFNLLFLPLFVPIVLAAKSFLDHEDFKMAINELVAKRTIILTILSLFVVLILQSLVLK